MQYRVALIARAKSLPNRKIRNDRLRCSSCNESQGQTACVTNSANAEDSKYVN